MSKKSKNRLIFDDSDYVKKYNKAMKRQRKEKLALLKDEDYLDECEMLHLDNHKIYHAIRNI